MATATHDVKTQGIKLEPKTRARLKKLGEARGRSPHWLMREAIENYLLREEQYEREKQEDMARWERYALTGKTVSQEHAGAWLKGLAKGKIKKCPSKMAP